MLEPEAGLIACNLGMCAAPARKRHKLYTYEWCKRYMSGSAGVHAVVHYHVQHTD